MSQNCAPGWNLESSSHSCSLPHYSPAQRPSYPRIAIMSHRPSKSTFNANNVPVGARRECSRAPPDVQRSPPVSSRAHHLCSSDHVCLPSSSVTCDVLAPGPAAGSDSDSPSESDESDETEDEDGEELTPVMDAAILRTLARIRRGEGVEEGRNVFEGRSP
jgi:hypothetical protein